MTSRRELASGVILFTTRAANNEITYEVEVAKLVAVEFTADFTGSANMR
jgi:hypothetical protein